MSKVALPGGGARLGFKRRYLRVDVPVNGRYPARVGMGPRAVSNRAGGASGFAGPLGGGGEMTREPSDRERSSIAVVPYPGDLPALAQGQVASQRLSTRAMKRSLDILLAVTAIVVTAPIWAVCVLAIALDDGSPVFYRQIRWGRGAATFTVLKFRTMARGCNDLRQAEVNDARVTRVGRILRATGLDELPQLVNVLRGDMSIVGPRPLAVGELVKIDGSHVSVYEDLPGFRPRLAVRPGLTSLATIYLPKDVHPVEKFNFDLRYIERASVWMDLQLIAISFWISVCGRWERRSSKVGADITTPRS